MAVSDDLRITTQILDQLEKVRESGRANMASVRDVQVAANALDCYAVVVFCQDVLDTRGRERTAAWTEALDALRFYRDHTGNVPEAVLASRVDRAAKQVAFDIMYGQGVSKVGEILDLGVKAGLVEKSGAWFSYDSIRIGQGRENAKLYLTENPDVAQRLENASRGKTEEVGEALMVGENEEADGLTAE